LELAVVIPMYNPGSWVVKVLEHMPAEVGLVVVVDDGSTDGSPELVQAYADPRVVLVSMGKNCGVGASWLRFRGAGEQLRRLGVKLSKSPPPLTERPFFSPTWPSSTRNPPSNLSSPRPNAPTTPSASAPPSSSSFNTNPSAK
jgi:hypothetical protein